MTGFASPAPQPPLPGGSGSRGAGCPWGPSRCCEVLTGCDWWFVVTWKKGERGMSWSRERGRARAGEGCRRKAEGEALVTVDVETVSVQVVGAQARDASSLVAHFVVKAHPVQAWRGGLLCVGADGVHACVVPSPHWPGKHKRVPERPCSVPCCCKLRPWGSCSHLFVGHARSVFRRQARPACPSSPASSKTVAFVRKHWARSGFGVVLGATL